MGSSESNIIMEAKVGFVILVFLLFLNLHVTMSNRKCGRHQKCQYKTNEASPYPVNFMLCDDRIFSYYYMICYKQVPVKRRRTRGFITKMVVQSKNEAQDFLSHGRQKRSSSRRRTDIMEECCTEGCRVEEIREYC
ncbi:uncharacterized protein [Montipora foliosa]|uniref:uncharacterized protein n=1 Tax=Montipora foliosa TaxID=591990 RepID=UPI0035F1518E